MQCLLLPQIPWDGVKPAKRAAAPIRSTATIPFIQKRLKGAALDVPYTSTHSSGSTTVVVDQTQHNNTWVDLGELRFSQETVTIELQNAPSGQATADAGYVIRERRSSGHTTATD